MRPKSYMARRAAETRRLRSRASFRTSVMSPMTESQLPWFFIPRKPMNLIRFRSRTSMPYYMRSNIITMRSELLRHVAAVHELGALFTNDTSVLCLEAKPAGTLSMGPGLLSMKEGTLTLGARLPHAESGHPHGEGAGSLHESCGASNERSLTRPSATAPSPSSGRSRAGRGPSAPRRTRGAASRRCRGLHDGGQRAHPVVPVGGGQRQPRGQVVLHHRLEHLRELLALVGLQVQRRGDAGDGLLATGQAPAEAWAP